MLGTNVHQVPEPVYKGAVIRAKLAPEDLPPMEMRGPPLFCPDKKPGYSFKLVQKINK